MKDVTLSQREQTRLLVLNSVMEFQLPRAQAAGILEISERQLRRVLAAYRRDGAAVLRQAFLPDIMLAFDIPVAQLPNAIDIFSRTKKLIPGEVDQVVWILGNSDLSLPSDLIHALFELPEIREGAEIQPGGNAVLRCHFHLLHLLGIHGVMRRGGLN